MAGYSSTPLYKKLGIKHGMTCLILHSPEGYFDIPKNIDARYDFKQTNTERTYELIHLFVDTLEELKWVPALTLQMRDDSMLWISWPKKSSKIKTDLDENKIREYILSFEFLVDIKVCAIDDDWSGLKIVFRKDHRSK